MPTSNVRDIILPTGEKIRVMEVAFDTLREDWSEYRLASGDKLKLRVKNIVTRIFLRIDEQDNIIYNENGEPTVVITGNQIVTSIYEEN